MIELPKQKIEHAVINVLMVSCVALNGTHIYDLHFKYTVQNNCVHVCDKNTNA